MLTIGIVFWDGDYRNYFSLIKRIKKRVHIPYEIIVIDNTTGGKLKEQAAYSFGYNAYQFAARYKILERAKGDYVWFIDGDDDIYDVNEMPGTEDIIVYSYDAIGHGRTYTNTVYNKNLFSIRITDIITCVLWNKFIKRSLFDLEFMKQYKDLQIVSNEDTLWCYSALKNASTVRTVSSMLYKHAEGFSNKQSDVSIETIKHVILGFNESQKIMSILVDNKQFYHKIMVDTASHILTFLPRIKDVHSYLSLISEVIPKEYVQEVLKYGVIKLDENGKAELKIIYGKDIFIRYIPEHVFYEDGTEGDVLVKVDWSGEEETVEVIKQ